MIPTEILVTVLIAYLVVSGVYYRIKYRKAKVIIAGLQGENQELRAALEILEVPKAGPGWTSKGA